MIGAIFAGGYGKRLQSLNPELPKVLLPLKDGLVILDKQLYDFESAGLDEAYLMIGYKGDAIVKRYGTHWNGIKIRYLREKEPMGTLWALTNLFSNIDSDVLLRNGDTICDLDLRKFAEFSQSNGKLVTMVIVRMRSPYGLVSLNRNVVTNFTEKPLLRHYVNGGIYFLRKEMKSHLKTKFKEKDIERSLFRTLAHKREIYAYKYSGFWKPVDNTKDYEEIKEIYMTREI